MRFVEFKRNGQRLVIRAKAVEAIIEVGDQTEIRCKGGGVYCVDEKWAVVARVVKECEANL